MTTTPNLDIAHLRSATAQPEVPVNQALDDLDSAITAVLPVSMDGGATTTLTQDQLARAFTFQVSESGVSPTDVTQATLALPAVKRGLFVVQNNAAFSVAVEIVGQTVAAPVVSSNSSSLLYSDGVNVRGASETTEDISGFYSGTAPSGDIIFQYVVPQAMTFLANFPSSYCIAGAGPTIQSDVTIEKNGVQIGYSRFLPAATSGVFTMATNTSFAAGDLITVRMPNPFNATLADVKITLRGIRG